MEDYKNRSTANIEQQGLVLCRCVLLGSPLSSFLVISCAFVSSCLLVHAGSKLNLCVSQIHTVKMLLSGQNCFTAAKKWDFFFHFFNTFLFIFFVLSESNSQELRGLLFNEYKGTEIQLPYVRCKKRQSKIYF